MGLLFEISKLTDFALFECGREKCVASKEICFTAKPYHLFHYVLYGKGFFELDGKMYELKKGKMFYIPPNVRPRYYPDKNDPWTYIWVAFGGIYADRLLQPCGLSRMNPIFSDSKDYRLVRYFMEISEEYSNKGSLNLKCLGLAYCLFSEMITISGGEETPELSPKDGHIKEAMEFIMYNYQFPITVGDIADSLNITSNYLANIFNERLGYSPKSYMINYRIEKACVLLCTGEYSIGEISKMVGYRNQLYFATEFKRVTGLTPTQYRQRREGRPDARIYTLK